MQFLGSSPVSERIFLFMRGLQSPVVFNLSMLNASTLLIAVLLVGRDATKVAINTKRAAVSFMIFRIFCSEVEL